MVNGLATISEQTPTLMFFVVELQMRWSVALIILTGLNCVALAETSSPWFGSEASVPVQINIATYGQQLSVSDQVSATEVDLVCPIEGCPTDTKLVKQPE